MSNFLEKHKSEIKKFKISKNINVIFALMLYFISEYSIGYLTINLGSYGFLLTYILSILLTVGIYLFLESILVNKIKYFLSKHKEEIDSEIKKVLEVKEIFEEDKKELEKILKKRESDTLFDFINITKKYKY